MNMRILNSTAGLTAPLANIKQALSLDGYPIRKAQMISFSDNAEHGIVTINTCLYVLQANFTANSDFALTHIDEPVMFPTSTVSFAGCMNLEGALFHADNDTAFAGTMSLDSCTINVKANGQITVRTGAVGGYCTNGGNNYVIFPINITYSRVPQEVLT